MVRDFKKQNNLRTGPKRIGCAGYAYAGKRKARGILFYGNSWHGSVMQSNIRLVPAAQGGL